MTEPLMVGLAAAQFATSVVIPIGIAALPAIWREIVKILKGMNIKRSSAEDQRNLSIIHTTMEKLERMPDLSWLRLPKASSLLAMLQSQAKSLKTMIDKYVLRIPKKRISERIKSIAVTLQILDNNEGLELYQKRKENLYKDLLDVLSKYNLFGPLRVASDEEYYNISMVTTFPGIRYEFQYHTAHGYLYPRTLTISSSVIECIEHVLRWLRDFKLSCGTVRGSNDVALYEVFTEILPEALMEHLSRSRYRLDQAKIKQFHSNVCFLRSFSVSSTFREIQGEAGLKLDDEEKISVDLCHHGWTTWNTLQQRIESKINVDLSNAGRPPRNALQQPFGDSRTSTSRSTTSSEIVDPNECVYCGLHLQGKNPLEVDSLRELHHNKCVKREETWLRRSSS
jgi:hypothetical protein